MKTNPFETKYDSLIKKFQRLSISTDKPGFCDNPSFLAIEKNNPDFLMWYAAFIAQKPYDATYLEHARSVINKCASILHKAMVKERRLGVCVDISGILSRILDQEKIWNCCLKSSLTVTFPKTAGISPYYYWSVDHGNFIAGHAWVFAPPYTVVDIAVGQQPYEENAKPFIPLMVLSEELKPVQIDVNDVVSPSARKEMSKFGIPSKLHLAKSAPLIPDIFDSFPPICIPGNKGSNLKYIPVAIHAPDGKFEDMRNMTFNGLIPWQFYKEFIT